jgi:hypothetical protein
MTAEAVVEAVVVRSGICYAFISSNTLTASGELVLEARDQLLLINGSNHEELRERVRSALKAARPLIGGEDWNVSLGWKLEMRYKWPEEKWINNVHTLSYARSLGYELPLVEGPATVDILLLSHQKDVGVTPPLRANWRCTGPLYKGRQVTLFNRSTSSDRREYALCAGSSDNFNTILSLEVT